MKSLVIVAAMTAALLCAGCGERSQALDAKARQYAGKLDAKPWQGDAPQAAGKFTAGDKASWESALRSRAQNQNEYTRAK